MWKKILMAVLAIVVVSGCVKACSSGSDEELSSVSVNSKAEDDEKDEGADKDDDKDGDKDSDVDENTDSEEEEPTAPEGFSVEEQVLWEYEGVKVTATGIEEDSFWGSELKILVENNSEKDITLTTDAVIVNGFMVSDLTVIDVTAGNKTNESITLLQSELEAAGIAQIGEIELYLRMYDPDSYDTIAESGVVSVTTSAYETMDTEPEIDGTVLYDENDIKIVAQYVDESSFWGSAMLLYIENNRSENIIVSSDEMAVNGYMVTGYLYSDVYAGRRAFEDLAILQSTLDDNGITSIEELQVEFSILDENFGTIAETGKLNLKLD